VLLSLISTAPSEPKARASVLDVLSFKLGLVVIGHPVDLDVQRIYSAEPEIPGHKIVLNHNSSDYLRSLQHHGVTVEIGVGPSKAPLRQDTEQ